MVEIKEFNNNGKSICEISILSHLTINDDMERLKEVFIDSLGKYSELRIQTLNEVELDISFIQLIIALKNKAEDMNKKVSLELNVSENSVELLKKSGLSNYILT